VSGWLLLVAGVIIPFRPVGIPVISVLGFLTMLAGSVIAVVGVASPGRVSAGNAPRSALAQRMEQRFRRRFEDDPIANRIRSTTRSPQQDQQAADHRRSPMMGLPTTKIAVVVVAAFVLIVIIGGISQSAPSQPIQSAPGTYPGKTYPGKMYPGSDPITSDPTTAAPTAEATTPSGWADVTLIGCTTKTEFGTTTANANVRIVNHTSHSAAYLVTVGLNNANGDRIGVATAASNDLPSGRTVTVTGMGTTNTPSASGGRCELSNVIRMP
jgi:hypothetical protein